MAAKTLHETPHYRWIDVTDLKKEEISEISAKYNINQLLLEDCIDPNHLPKFEDLGDLKFFLTRLNASTERLSLNTISDVSTKLGIFLRENLIITIHRTEIDGIKSLSQELKSNLKEHYNPYEITLMLARKIFRSFEEENDVLLDQLDKMEHEIFLKNNSNPNQIKRLYRFKRKTGLYVKVLNLSSEWINSLEKLPLNGLEIKDLKDSYKDAISDFDHLNQQVNNLIGIFIALSDQKANQVMKMLAIYSVYFLPITFIAGLYGMNFDNMPELHTQFGYFITLGLMGTIVLVTFIYMRKKKW